MIQLDARHLNRMGDALAAIPWMASMARRHGGARVVDDQFCEAVRPLLPDDFGLRFGPGRDDDSTLVEVPLHPNFALCNSAAGVGLHMAQGYFRLAGDDVPSMPMTLRLREGTTYAERCVAISPFSASDHDHNKAWFEDRWHDVVRAILDDPSVDEVLVLGGELDDPAAFLGRRVRSVRGTDLREVLSILRTCRLFISVDNGLSHLAHFGGVSRHLLLAPQCLAESFVANPRGRMVRGVPVEIPAVEVIRMAREMLACS